MTEEFSYWQRAKEEIGDSYENCPPFKEMAQAAASQAYELKLPKEQFDEQLYKLYDAYNSFLHATNTGTDESKWLHWRNHYRHARLGKKWGEPHLSSELLSDAAAIYLSGALRVPRMDRALIDALIAQETFAFIDQKAGRGGMFAQFGCFAIAGAAVIVWQLLFSTVDWHRVTIGIGIYVAVLGLLYFWPRRGLLKLHRAMRDTYHLLSGSVVSLPEVRRSVERARESGVVWPPELYAVLDDVEARTRTL